MSMLRKQKIGETGYIFILDSKANYILSSNKNSDGKNIWNAKDKNGKTPIDYKKASKFYKKGFKSYIARNFVDAVNFFEKSLKIRKRAVVYYYYANSLLNISARVNDSIKAFEKALNLKYSEKKIYYGLAISYSKLGEIKKSFENLEAAIEVGFSNFSKIKSDIALENIRRSKRWKKFLEKNIKKEWGVCTGDSVNVRKGKGFSYSVIDSLNKGDRVLILKKEKYSSSKMVILKKRSIVKIDGRRYRLSKGKALLIVGKKLNKYRVSVNINGEIRKFLINKNMILSIGGYVKIKTPEGNIGWTVLKYIETEN